MAHHSGKSGEEFAAFAKLLGLGETGQFPRGKVIPEDEGELRFGITIKNGEVILAFGKPIAWLGMSPQEAAALGDLLRRRADEAGASEE